LTHMNSSMKTAPLLPVARISSPTNMQTEDGTAPPCR
jgi:hypothetical protein